MRLLVGYVLVLMALLIIQSVRPDCSMTDMVGVEWLECLAR
jgi:hypothetical protein